MAWLSRVNFTASDVLSYTDLNNLGNDIRAWGGNVNGGAYTLSNVVLSATSGTMATVIGGTGTTSALTLRSTSGVGTTGADIIFQTGNNGATEVMRLQNGGNVGIGTSSPSTYDSKLAVNGNIGLTTIGQKFYPYYISATNNNYISSAAGGEMVFGTGTSSPSERMRIDSSGNIIVGNASAAVNTLRNLDLYNTDTGASAGVITRMITSDVAGTGVAIGQIIKYKNGAMTVQNTETDLAASIQFGVGASERMRIDSVGNVKVGGTADRATTAGTNQVVIFNGTAPVGTLSNGCSFYSTAGEMRVMDAAGNATLLSPHDSVTNEWIYDSSHTPSGKRLKINVERLLRFINDHFGLDCVRDLMEEA